MSQGIDHITPRINVALHATAVDFINPDGILTDLALPAHELCGRGHVNEAVVALRSILGLKATRNSASRAVPVDVTDFSSLRPASVHALALLDRMSATAIGLGVTPGYYGLADVGSTPPDRFEAISKATRFGHPIYTRPEEGLTHHAADIAHTIKTMVASGQVAGARMADDSRIERTTSDGVASLSLYGYTFRHDPSEQKDAVVFPAFPSCEAFIAATVLEQLAVAGSVIRVVPRTFKKKEYAARWILEAMGCTDLPVISVASGDSGGLNKIIPWSRVDSPARRVISAMRASAN